MLCYNNNHLADSMKRPKDVQGAQASHKMKMFTLNGRDPSNKNININISYNLTEPKVHCQKTQNQIDYQDSLHAQAHTTASDQPRQSFFGKKLSHRQVLVTENANCQHKDISKCISKKPLSVKAIHMAPEEEVSNQYQISIKLINKQRKRPRQPESAPISRKQSPLNRLEPRCDVKLIDPGCYTQQNSPAKRLPKKKPKKRLVKAGGQPRTQMAKASSVQMKEPASANFLKHRWSEYKPRNLVVSPYPTPSNSVRNSQNRCFQSAKKQQDEIKHKIEKQVLRRIIRVSQLSYAQASQSCADDIKDLGISPPQAEQHTKDGFLHLAANKIKDIWKQYRRLKVLNFYGQMFQGLTVRTTTQLDSIPHVDDSYVIDTQRLATQNLQQLVKKRHNTLSANVDQEDSQFNIKKYEDLQKADEAQKVNPSEIERFKQHQIEKWSEINHLIRDMMKGKSTNSDQLLLKLIEESQKNKKWIEENCRQTKKAASRLSSPCNHYEDLVLEKGIAEKVFKDSLQVKKKLLENQQSIIKSKRSQRSSLSQNSIGSHRRHSSLDDIDNTFKDENYVSQMIQSQQQEIKPSESITSYLDCGLSQFEFKNHQIEVEVEKIERADNPLAMSLDREEQIEQKQSVNIDQKVEIFDQIYNSLINQASEQLFNQHRMYISFRRSFLNVPPPKQKAGIKCNNASVREYLTNFVFFILKNVQYSVEVTKNLNFNLGPSSREILFYLRAETEDAEADFVEEEGYLFAIPLNIFEAFEMSQPTLHNNIKMAMISHHWHRAIFQTLNEMLDCQRPFGAHGKPYIWSNRSGSCNKKIVPTCLPNVFRSAVNRLLEMISLPCGIMFDIPQCPYYNSQLMPEERAKVNQDRISLMLADQLFENEPTVTNYDDEITEVMLQMTYYMQEKIFYEVAVELRKLKRSRAFL